MAWPEAWVPEAWAPPILLQPATGLHIFVAVALCPICPSCESKWRGVSASSQACMLSPSEESREARCLSLHRSPRAWHLLKTHRGTPHAHAFPLASKPMQRPAGPCAHLPTRTRQTPEEERKPCWPCCVGQPGPCDIPPGHFQDAAGPLGGAPAQPPTAEVSPEVVGGAAAHRAPCVLFRQPSA